MVRSLTEAAVRMPASNFMPAYDHILHYDNPIVHHGIRLHYGS